MAAFSSQHNPIHVIGAGGSGTYIILTLIQMGATEIHVWDDDTVSHHNRPSQFMYCKSDVGKRKVDGVRRFVKAQGYGTIIHRHGRRVDATTPLSGIVISGVDSMASRKEIWRGRRAWGGLVTTYMDVRISDEYVHISTLNPYEPAKGERYEKTLLDDTAAPDASCATRENASAAPRAVSHVSKNLSRLLAGEPVEFIIYEKI